MDMDYGNKFTDNLQKVFELSEQVAEMYHLTYIGSSHMKKLPPLSTQIKCTCRPS